MYITAAPRDKRKKEQKMVGQIARGHGHGGRLKLSPMDQCWRPAPLIGAPEGGCPPSKPPELTSGVGIFCMGNIPRSIRALEISTTNCDSCPASASRSSPISSMHALISLLPPIDLACRRDAGRSPAPLPVSPLCHTPKFKILECD
jgi:hypothetical protein